MTNAAFRKLPAVSDVLAHPAVAGLLAEGYRQDVMANAVRERIATARAAVARGATPPTAEEVALDVTTQTRRSEAHWPAAVLNATGVILHTNLGRAPLSAESIRAAAAASEGYSTLELDLDDGKRGSRHAAVAGLLRQLTSAQDAIAVNNNAGAVMLGLAAVAAGREVIVSRGEASEIGGGFRIPDVLAQSGARLVEVGTVNKTYAADYERAITEQTAALLVVHRSNFRVVGFTHEPPLADVAGVGAAHSVPVLHDLGSGALLDTAQFGIRHETMPQESLAAGADLVFFSGDKLLGGPQAGLAAGRSDLVAALRGHPLARALRADKLTLAALHQTLLHYVRGEAMQKVPVWRMVSASEGELTERAQALAERIGPAATVAAGASRLGGGSLPSDELPTSLVRIDASGARGPDELARLLRVGSPAVVARIEDDRVLLDPRTVPPERDAELAEAVGRAFSTAEGA
ncbi:MAG: L-seryl-tRNA(Sec) selenium transferase [Chloroflexota bacterium]|nr:L-seryl-tRNA(Sec) selenium transferase [Chloroflexota bacterium]MDE2885345.1 L-seryl-tRNA(Sec) selenium transferase [Chloroflexota bacterium]